MAYSTHRGWRESELEEVGGGEEKTPALSLDAWAAAAVSAPALAAEGLTRDGKNDEGVEGEESDEELVPYVPSLRRDDPVRVSAAE